MKKAVIQYFDNIKQVRDRWSFSKFCEIGNSLVDDKNLDLSKHTDVVEFITEMRKRFPEVPDFVVIKDENKIYKVEFNEDFLNFEFDFYLKKANLISVLNYFK